MSTTSRTLSRLHDCAGYLAVLVGLTFCVIAVLG